MENKYYTPEISEFYAGFEYEYKPRAREGLMSYVRNNFTYINRWDKDVFNKKSENFLEALEVYDRPYNIGDIYTYIEDKAVRVKYLDKEDIESFGFKYIDEDTYILPMLFKPIIFSPGKVWGDIIMHYHPEDNYTSITGFSEGQEEEYTLFMGLIKNKSELKKILQMTGVL